MELVFCQNGFLKLLRSATRSPSALALPSRQSHWRDPGAGRCAEPGAVEPGRGRIPAGACCQGRQPFTCRGGKGLDLSPAPSLLSSSLHPDPQLIELLEGLFAVHTVPQKVVRKLPTVPSRLST